MPEAMHKTPSTATSHLMAPLDRQNLHPTFHGYLYTLAQINTYRATRTFRKLQQHPTPIRRRFETPAGPL